NSLNIVPSVSRENPLRPVGDVDNANTSVIAAGETSCGTRYCSAVRRPGCAAQKEIRMLSGGEFLLSGAVCIRNYYGVFAFTYITTLKSETFSVGREANSTYIFQKHL